jgi:predicted lipoprotein with Yx(FWY)xxD motif
MSIKPLIGLVALAAIGLAACGGGSNDATTAAAPAPAPTETTAPAPAAPAVASTVAVKVADSKAGKILIGPDGKTLYGFTNDIAATSTCYSTCAAAWPPVIVGAEWSVGPGLDSGVFSTVARDDGTTQLVAGKFPLYEYSGDAAPGDANGQGSGDVWFVVGTDAKLVKGAAANESAAPTTVAAAAAPTTVAAKASVTIADSPLGKIMVDADGRTLYGFTNDKDGTSTCNGSCAKAWPAATITGDPVPGDGVTAALSVVDAPAGGKMLKAGKWPLYRFSGDAAAGDTNGQGSGGVWFVVGADGKLIKS